MRADNVFRNKDSFADGEPGLRLVELFARGSMIDERRAQS